LVVVKIRTVLLPMMVTLSRHLPSKIQPADKQFKKLLRAPKERCSKMKR